MGAAEGFRDEVRAWFRDNGPPAGPDGTWQAEWLRMLNGPGFAAPHVPREWGGGGFTLDEQIVVYEEWARSGAPSVGRYLISVLHLPSTLLAAGTPEQQQRFIRDAINGTVWCQGFSEPGAGSDLASLRTRARRDGSGWVVDGQKVWSSNAAHARYCLLLARTDPESRRGHGISYFILDMASPGVDVRPIRQNTGHDEFCEIFLDGVRIPADAVIGPEGEGWFVAQSTLKAERGPIAVENIERIAVGLERLAETVAVAPAGRVRAVWGERLAQLAARVTSVRALGREVVAQLVADPDAPTLEALLKIAYTELLQDVTSFGVDVAGTDMLVDPARDDRTGALSGDWMIDWIGSWGATISSGTNEIQRNIVAGRLLGMPAEPRVMAVGT